LLAGEDKTPHPKLFPSGRHRFKAFPDFYWIAFDTVGRDKCRCATGEIFKEGPFLGLGGEFGDQGNESERLEVSG